MLPDTTIVATAASGLVERLLGADADDEPCAIVFESRRHDAQHWPRRRLRTEVLAFAAALRGVAEPGERALIILPTGPDYVIAFLGCLASGVIAVPVTTMPRRPAERERLEMIAQDSKPKVVIGGQETQALAAACGAVVLSPEARHASARQAGECPHAAQGADIAFLQYTSGSTASPKGVMITLDNLRANLETLAQTFGAHRASTVISWLPLYHDMGLIGCLLMPLYAGCRLVLTSPMDFAERPQRWLELVTAYRGTITLAPNFAFQLCIERIEDDQLAGLDLSRLRMIGSGAEPIRPALMARFVARFAPFGLADGATRNCYGLAEATLMVTSTLPADGSAPSVRFDTDALAKGRAIQSDSGAAIADCGPPAVHCDVAIVDPIELRRVRPGCSGEIWAAGPGISPGYWRNPEASAAMDARLADDDRCWLRTGDLGFLHEGRLFVAGRLKDLIILRGQNIAPQDIEDCIEHSVPGLRPGRIAAFPVGNETGESIGIAAELARGRSGGHDVILTAIRAAVAEAFDAAPTLVLLLGSGKLPRTTSGKLRRSACLPGWQDGSIVPVASFGVVPERAAEEETAPDVAHIAALWRELLGHTPAPDADFFVAGGHSLLAAALAARIEAAFGWTPPPGFVFAARTPVAQARALAEGRAARAPQESVVADAVVAPDALSVLQRALWTEHLLDPQNVANNIGAVLTLRGRLDLAALHDALAALVRRHPAFHSLIDTEDGTPVWRPCPDALPELSHHVAANDEHVLHRMLTRPFDLAAATPLRACVVTSGGDRFRLLLAMHHIAADGTVAPTLLAELGHLYDAARGAEPAALADPPPRPADPPIRDEDRAFWRTTLADLPERLDLAADRERTQPHDGSFWRAERRIAPATQAALVRHAAATGTTAAASGLAVFAALLHRASGGTEDIVVGVPVSLRPAQAAGWAGHCMNAVPVRLAAAADISLRDLLERTATSLAAAITHARLPFPALVDMLRPPRDALTTPVFRAMFNHRREEPAGDRGFTGLAIGPLDDMAAAAPFDVTLEMVERPGGTHVALDLARDIFDRETAEQLIDDYLVLADQLAAGGGEALGTLLPAPPAPAPALPEPRFGPDAAVRRGAEAHPDREAICCGPDDRLTYAALDALADTIAEALRASAAWPAARPERIVGLAMTRSATLAAAILGIWRAGAALLPLDLATPPARINFMLRDCDAALLLADDAGMAAPVPVLPVLPLATSAAPVGTTPSRRASPAQPQQLAYVLYTSGSTGEPKGVAIPHEALTRHLDDFIAAHRICADDTVLQSSTVGFDVFLHELFPALMVGGRVVMRGAAPWSFDTLNEALSSGVTFARIPTSFWRQWLPHAPKTLPALRQITVGGEALPGDALATWQAGGLRDIALDNLYGPTETTIACLRHAVVPADAAAAVVSIGRPYRSRTASIRDRAGNPAVRGGTGELCIGGPTVARGYCHRPSLTAERFVPDLNGAPGGRLYRTGDLARWRADGSIDFLGRIDAQIKLRGIRIEPAEIETVLRKTGGVDDAVVMLRDIGPAPTLVAYVAGGADSDDLRRHLAERLPAAMVPARFVVLKTFPLLPSGKVDRAALPSPAEERALEAEAGSATEAVLRDIWREVLAVETVGVTDDFFGLGGDSILALRVIARAREQRLVLSPRHLFEAPTIAGLARLAEPLPGEPLPDPPDAAALRDGARMRLDSAAVGIDPDLVEAILPVTPLQRGLLLLAAQSAQDPYFAQHVFVVDGIDGPETLRAAFSAAITRHAGLRTRFAWPEPDQPCTIIYRAAKLRLIEHDWRPLDDAAAAASLAADWTSAKARGFDFAAAAPHLLLIRRAATRYWLVWRLHHAQIDGWSLALVLDEIARGVTSTQAAPPFARYVAWLSERDPGKRLAAWRERLDDIDAPTPLPRARPVAAPLPFGEQALVLAPAACTALVEAARRHGVTMSTLVQAAWAWLFARHADADRVVFGVTVAGRPETLADVERIVGLFINTMPLIVALDPTQPMKAWLAAIQSDMLDLWEDADLPAHALQAQSALPPGVSLFDSIVVFENYPVGRTLREGRGRMRLRHITPDRGADGIRHHHGRNHYGLSLIVQPQGVQADDPDRLQFALSYATDRFDDATAAALLGQFHSVLRRLCESRPDAPLGSLSPRPAVLAAETSQEDAQADAQEDAQTDASCSALLARIARRAETEPDALALVTPRETMSWKTLWELSGRRAAQLKALGVGTETVVAFCLPRGSLFVGWLLAVWRAGGAYAPLDPAHPPARLREIVQRGNCRFLVADGDADWRPADVTLVDRDGRNAAPATAEPQRHPAQTAYVIHTSGSTGRPKGVVVGDGALVGYLDAVAPLLPTDVKRAAWVSSPAADLGHTVLMGALWHGWVLHIPCEDDLFVPERFAAFMRDSAIDLVKMTPSHLQAVLETRGALPARCLVLGGEATSAALLSRISELRPDCSLINHYGPTETTVGVLAGRITDMTAAPALGRPLAHARITLRGRDGGGVAPGMPGEICVTGSAVARGYLGTPGPTADRFVPSDSGPPGSRLYRTGDRGRLAPDGSVRFLGRADAQVKINGVRVEPSEVEACLAGLPGVARCVVLAVPGPAGGERLMAWVVGEADPVMLRAELSRRLPGAMIPASIVSVGDLPLTANGKLDRKRLPRRDERRETPEPIGRPETAQETLLREIWQVVLKRPSIGLREDFFALGGDSIASLQIIARARESGLYIEPRDVFAYSTVEGLATVARTGRAVSRRHVVADVDLPLTPIQNRFFQNHPHGESHFSQAVVLRAPAVLDEVRLREALHELVLRNDALRLRFRRESGEWRQRVAVETAQDAPAFVALRSADLGDVPDVEAAFAEIRQACHRATDIGAGPLLSALHVRLPGGEGRLMLAIHHLAVDGVSWRILTDDLRTLLRGQSLPAQQSTSWSRWTQHLAAYAAPREELDVWRKMLAGADAALPVDETSETRIAASREIVVRFEPQETTQALTLAADAWHMRPDGLLLAALAQTLSAWRGRAGALLEMEGHGREDVIDDVDLSRTVGWFTTRYPLWLRLGGDAPPATALVAVKEALHAVPSHGFHYGLLAPDGLRPNVSFNYLGRFDADSGDWAMLADTFGAGIAPEARMTHALDINAMVVGGGLSVSWRYSPGAIADGTAGALADAFVTRLRALSAYCLAHPAPRSAGDYPLAGLDRAGLTALDLDLDEVADLYVATPLQAGLLMHAEEAVDPLRRAIAGSRQAYVNQLRTILPAGIEVGALRAAWRAVVARHDVLRSAFIIRSDGPPLQCVRHAVDLPLELMDWRDASDDYDARLGAWRAADLARGIDAAVAPLQRVALLRRPDDRLDMVWTHHHALTDSWSAVRIFDDLATAYAAIRAGSVPAFAAARPFRDYVAWLAKQRLDEGWWRTHLDGIGDDARLLDAIGTSEPTGAPAVERIRLTGLMPALESAARRRRVTLNTLFQAALALVLSRFAGRRRVVFGITVSGRPPDLAGATEMVGLFINSMPMRVAAPAHAKLDDWLRAVQAASTDLSRRAHVPLAQMQRLAGQQGQPLFDSLLAFENYPFDATVGGAIRPDHVEVDERTHFPLAITVTPGADAQVRWSWDKALIPADTARDLLDAYLGTLDWLTTADDVHLGDHMPPGAGQVAGLLETTPREGEPAAVHGVTSRIAAHRRDAVAVICGDEALDYGALLSRAACLSRRLGPSAEQRVGLCIGRSAALVWGLLGIMGSGAAYVPLDPAYPQARLAQALADAGITRIVADTKGAAALGDLSTGREIIRIEDISRPHDDTARLALALHPAQLAYVIYTSGSTGVPKGVAVSHGALLGLLDAMDFLLSIEPSDRWLSVTSISFDIAALELLLPLVKGATVIVAREHAASDGVALAGLLASSRASIMQATPSGWKLLLAAGWRDDPDGDRSPLRGLSGGEALPTDLAQTLAGRGVSLWNVYGPTETTIWSSGAPVTPALLDGAPHARLGEALAGERICILSEDGLAAPHGGVGELCIGGAGLARGYLQRPSLTAEKFVPDPAGAPGARLYRTGDLVRADAFGLAYLGRLDQQVKLRGHRIELGEIEAAMRAVPGVADAAAMLHGQAAKLVGYVTGRATPDAVRAHVGEHLPAIMVPQIVVAVDALPLTPNGKLDRGRLREPQAGATGIAPRNETEARVVQAVAEVLELSGAFVDDNFFHLGGDSILGMRLVVRLRGLGLRLTTRQIFEAPVLGDLAAQARPHVEQAALVLAKPEGLPSGVDDIYPATSVQSGMLYHGLRAPGTGVYVGQLRMRLGGSLDLATLHRSFAHLIARHAILRTGFELSAQGSVRQVVQSRIDWRPTIVAAPAEAADYEAADYEAYASRWCAADRARGFDVAQAPLLRVAILHRPDGGVDLVWTSHHALLDGWSQSRLLGELSLTYEALRKGGMPSLGPVRPYRDYIAWLGRRDEAASQAWWRAMFDGDEPALLLPSFLPPSLGDARSGHDRPDAAGQLCENLPKTVAAALRATARRHGLTMGTLLQGAFALLLARYGGRRRVAFGVTVSGRPEELDGVDTMMGLFINSLPFWIDVRGDANLWSFLDGLQRQAGALREHAHTPLPLLQRWSGRSNEDLFDSLLVVENYPAEAAARSVAGDLAPRDALVLGRPHYPLTIAIEDGEDGLSLRWMWDGARLCGATVAALRRDYAAALDWISATEDAQLGDWAPPSAARPRPLSVVAAAPFRTVLSRIAACPRDAVALVSGDERLDYATLLARASGLSQRLGPSVEERVGLCVTRSAGMIWGLLGIMGAGAAYVPLDPAYPRARLAHVLQDAGMRRVVADASGIEALGHLAGAVETIRLETVATARDPGMPALRHMPHPQQLAYVIYTSGSTGAPKGVGITHGSLAGLLDATRAFGFGADDRWTLFHSFAFDFSVWEIFGALAHGGQLVVVPHATTRDPAAFHALLQAERVTVLNQTPSAFVPLMQVDIAAPARLDDLRLVIFGGEKLSPATLDPWRAARGARMPHVVNMYGITETTVHVTARTLDGRERTSVIGQPIGGWSLDLLGEDGTAVPIGGTGEICVGGTGLARGYLGRPGLTAERFVPDPAGAPGARLYRSGDTAATTLDGEPIYRGRADRQVKLRGHRIELGEIEAAMRAMPGVADAAAMLHGDGTRLVGYVVGDLVGDLAGDGAGSASPEAVRDRLGERLPAIMVPQIIVALDALPLTPNGKLDRSRLREPEVEASGVAPQNETEAAICAAFAEVLGVARVDRDSRFFALGGDSIGVMTLSAALSARFGTAISVADVFRHATPAALAARLADRLGTQTDTQSIDSLFEGLV